jgi:cell division protein ZapA
MDRRTVSLHVAGQSYRVITTAPEGDLQRLAGIVGSKLAEVSPRPGAIPPQAMLLAAIALAHELEEERSRRQALELRARDMMRRVLVRLDETIGETDGANAATED